MPRSLTPAPGPRITGIRLAGFVVVLALAGCQGATGPGSQSTGPAPQAGDPAAASTALPNPPTVHRLTATPQGTQFQVPATDRDLAGVRIVIPPGALAKETGLTISVGPTTPDVTSLAEADPAFFFAFADALTASLPPGTAHPIYTPFLALGAARLVGPPLELGPDGLAFEVPIEVNLPTSLVGEVGDDLVVAALRSRDGTWEISDDVTITDDGLQLAIPHFSGLRVMRVAQNVLANPSADVDPAWLAAAQARLGAAPLAATERAILRLLACEAKDAVRVDRSKLPASLAHVLNYLGRDSGEIGDVNVSDVIRGLEDYVDAQRRAQVASGQRSPKHFLALEALFEEALRLTKLDAFQALVAVHGVLRDNRTQPQQLGNEFQDALALLRGDGGDEDGARYHYFGAAIYSFVYAHQADLVAKLAAEHSGDADLLARMRVAGASFAAPDPATTVRLEEAWVSGDIFSDVTEYAVDLQGVAFGRAVYEHVTARAAGQESPVTARLCTSMEGELDLTSMPGVDADAVEAFEKLVSENRISLAIEQGDTTAAARASVTGEFVLTIVLSPEFLWGIQTGIGQALGGGAADPMPPSWADCSATTKLVGTMKGQQVLAGTKGIAGFEGTATIKTTSTVRGCEDTGANIRASKPQTMAKIPWSAVGDETAIHGEIQMKASKAEAAWTLSFDVRRP